MAVFVLRIFDGNWPSRVAVVILANDRYEATEKAEQYLETKGYTLEQTVFEVADALEHDTIEEVFVV